MNKILLASHGYLAQGMKSSLEILMGTNDRIECLCAYVDDDSRDVAALIDAWMETRDPADSWFVVTDIFGGSVNNEFIQRQTDGSFTLKALACAGRAARRIRNHPLCGWGQPALQSRPLAGHLRLFRPQGIRVERAVVAYGPEGLQPVAHEVDVQVPRRVHAEV